MVRLLLLMATEIKTSLFSSCLNMPTRSVVGKSDVAAVTRVALPGANLGCACSLQLLFLNVNG